MDRIKRAHFKTRAGHDLSVFFNVTTGLLVIDLNHKTKAGGYELIRQTLDERNMLAHCRNLPTYEEA